MVSLVPFGRPVIRRVQKGAVLAALATVLAVGPAAAPQAGRDDQAGAKSDGGDLFGRVWAGVENAERAVTNACGALTETRVSPLLARPLVLRGTFCAAGLTAFRLDYVEPERLHVIYNEGILNVTTDSAHQTDVLDIGRAVRRTQDYFGGPHSLKNVRRDFSLAAVEDTDGYTVTLIPLSKRFSARVREVVVRLGHADFLLRRLEIRGTNGVHSVYDVRIERTNVPLDAQTFQVRRPQTGRTKPGSDGD